MTASVVASMLDLHAAGAALARRWIEPLESGLAFEVELDGEPTLEGRRVIEGLAEDYEATLIAAMICVLAADFLLHQHDLQITLVPTELGFWVKHVRDAG